MSIRIPHTFTHRNWVTEIPGERKKEDKANLKRLIMQ